MKSFHMIKLEKWPVSCHFLTFFFATIGFIACSQQTELYDDLTGDYEYFMEGQYIPSKVFIKNDTLMCDVGVGIILALEPVDIDELRFKSENEGSLFDIRFERESNGSISRFIFTAGDVIIPVEKRVSEPADRLFSVEEIQEDFNQLRHTIERTHPALYSFMGKKEFDRFFEQQLNRIDKPMTLESIYPVFASMTAKVGCGHSVAMMPEGYWERLEGKMFPIHLKFIENHAYVKGTFNATDSIPKGSAILSVNGNTMEELVAEMRNLISTDAYSLTYSNFRLGKRFSYLYALLYGHPESFSIQYTEIGNSIPKEIIVNPVPVQNLPKEMENHHGLGLEIIEERKVAILTISHFAFYDNRDFFYRYIDDAFNRMDQENIVNLILDVRGNTGGDPFCAAHLFSYLEKEPVPYFSQPYGEYFRLSQAIPLHPNHFEGELITLIDGGGFSTTGHFTALLKYHNIGTLIGEETGGTYTCNDGSRSYQLKNTRIQGHIASKTFAVEVHDLPRNRGIIPDHPVVQSPEDLANGIDTALEYALSKL